MITFNLPGLETGTKIDHNGSVVSWGDSIEELLEHIRTSNFNITTKEKLIETINKITDYDCRYLFTEKTISGEINYYIIKRKIDGRYVVCDTPIVRIRSNLVTNSFYPTPTICVKNYVRQWVIEVNKRETLFIKKNCKDYRLENYEYLKLLNEEDIEELNDLLDTYIPAFKPRFVINDGEYKLVETN